MGLSHTLLGFLSYEPMTGYQLKQCFEKSINHFWDAHVSQIYRELASMEKKGWVTHQIEPQAGKPDKKIYTLTAEGDKELLAWLKSYSEDSGEVVRSEFLARVFFSARLDEQEIKYELTRYMRKKQEDLKLFQEISHMIQEKGKGGLERDSMFWHMTLRQGILLAEAAVVWAAESIGMLEAEENEKKGMKDL